MVLRHRPGDPASTKAILLAALAFFVIPKPFRPKRRLPIPGLIMADDAAVIAAAIAFANRARSSLATASWPVAP